MTSTAKRSIKSPITDFRKHNIAVVIPCYRVEREINTVITNLPRYLKYIIIVDDASPDKTAEIVETSAKKDPRILLICHEKIGALGEPW